MADPVEQPHDLDGEKTSTRRRFVGQPGTALDHILADSVKNSPHDVPRTGPTVRSLRDDTDKISKAFSVYYASLQAKTPEDWVETFLPIWRWLKSYKWKTTFPLDLVAGLTVGVMVIPQGLSYAGLAGLPPQYGLYSALMPVYAYSLFGTSRQLAIGPVALVSLLMKTGLTDISNKLNWNAKQKKYLYNFVPYAVQTSFFVGLLYILLGLLRLGFLTNFMSHAVISGFTTGACVTIGMSQLGNIFGYKTTNSDRFIKVMKSIIDGIHQFNYRTFIIGTLGIAFILSLKYVGRKNPKYKWVGYLGPFLLCVISIALVDILDLNNRGVPVVGHIPKGFPPVSTDYWTPVVSFSDIGGLIIEVTIVGFMESVAIAKRLAAKHGYEIDTSTELIGLGMANFFGSMFSAYPVTGSFSRSSVSNESGAQSGLAGIITATVVLFAVLVLTPLFQKVPKATLSAIIISGVWVLIDFPEAQYLYKVDRIDLLVWLASCLGTIFAGVEIGLGIAVGLSLLVVIYEAAYPQTSVLGRLPGTNVYRNVKQYPEAESYDGILIARIDAPLFFANSQNVRDVLRKYRQRAEAETKARDGTYLKYVIIDLSPVGHIDSSALHMLSEMIENYESRGQYLIFSNPSLRVMTMLENSGLAEKIGEKHIFIDTQEAVSWCLKQLDLEANKADVDAPKNGEETEGFSAESS